MSSRFTIPFLQTMRRLLFVYLSVAGLMVMLLAVTSLIVFLSWGSLNVSQPATTVEATVDFEHPALFGPAHDFLNGVVEGWKDGAAGVERPQPERAAEPPQLSPTPPNGTHELVPDKNRQLLRYQETSPWKRLLLLQLGMTSEDISLGVVVYTLVSGVLLYRIMRDVKPKTPFTTANARRIRRLGILLIAADVYQQLVYVVLPLLVPPFREPSTGKLLSQYIVLTPRVEYGSWAVGLMLLVIAAVYQRGIELQQEAELTV